MGKKGKGYYQQEEEPNNKKKNMITLEQLMDKSHMDNTQFIPYLDTEALLPYPTQNQYTEAALRKIVSDLNHVLYVDFKKFWATALYNISFRHCLSSCLSHLNRKWMNNYKYSAQSQDQFNQSQQTLQAFKRVKDLKIYEYIEGIYQVVLMIYYRIVNFNFENKELAGLYKLQEQITRQYILDFPKLFELIQIYGETNSGIVKHIVTMYSKILPNFYNVLTNMVLPLVFKKTEEALRKAKLFTQRQQFGISYSYNKLKDQQKSQGEQQLSKKICILMEMINFSNIIKNIILYFPQDCRDHCFFNSKIQLYYQNIFFELQMAYKTWNYQKQEINILNKINFLLKDSIEYMLMFFNRANEILVLRTRKSITKEAYINSLQRIFKQFGKRLCLSKKNQTKNMLLYNIIQKKFNLIKMAQMIYSQEVQDGNSNFNLQYLKDFIISLENENKDSYINQAEQQRQEQIQQQTQAPLEQQRLQQFDQKVQASNRQIKQGNNQQRINNEQYLQPQTDDLQLLVSKRLRSQDYYSNLYKDFNNKNYYKGQYEDDYDDLIDYDKRPLFQNQQSSDDQSQAQQERHLVSNMSHLNHVKQLHNKNNQNIKKTQTKNPKYSRMEETYQNNNNQSIAYDRKPQYKGQQNNKKGRQEDRYSQEKVQKQKLKYIAKQKPQQAKIEIKSDINYNQYYPDESKIQMKQQEVGQQTQQRNGGKGYKKSNKSYNYKPKDKEPNRDKGGNTNKTKDYDRSNGNGGKKHYKPK